MPKLTFEEKQKYLEDLEDKLTEYSFKPRRQGDPENEGTRDWLAGIDNAHPSDPANYACWIMQGWNFCYQKQTAGRIRKAWNSHLE